MEGAEAGLPEQQVAGGYRQEVDAAAKPHKEGELCQALNPSLRCPESELESKGAEPALPEEQEAGGYRQEVDAAARSHQEGELCQALALSPRCPGCINPDLSATS